MKVKLIRIGNSQGIRIPKPLIEQCGFKGDVEMHVEESALVISAVRSSREGWNESFATMAGRADDVLLLDEGGSSWDDEEWTW